MDQLWRSESNFWIYVRTFAKDIHNNIKDDSQK